MNKLIDIVLLLIVLGTLAVTATTLIRHSRTASKEIAKTILNKGV
jgi:hypothetical protein